MIPVGQPKGTEVQSVQFAQVNVAPDASSSDADIIIRNTANTSLISTVL